MWPRAGLCAVTSSVSVMWVTLPTSETLGRRSPHPQGSVTQRLPPAWTEQSSNLSRVCCYCCKDCWPGTRPLSASIPSHAFPYSYHPQKVLELESLEEIQTKTEIACLFSNPLYNTRTGWFLSKSNLRGESLISMRLGVSERLWLIPGGSGHEK